MDNLLNKFKKSAKSLYQDQPVKNPWDAADDLIIEFQDSYKQENRDFSWLYIDEKLKKLVQNNELPLFPNSTHYAIPTHTQGNINEGNIYLCLVNPNIVMYDKDKPTTLKHFYDEFSLKGMVDKSSQINKLINNIDEIKNIINSKESIIEIEFVELINEIKDKESEKLNNDEIPKKIKKILKNYYYINTYFKKLLIENDKYNAFEYKLYEISQNNEKFMIALKRIKDAKICNLELFPFRSQNPAGLGRYLKNFKGSDVLSYSIHVILNRIYMDLVNESDIKPIFLFRRFNFMWLNQFKNVLCDKNQYNMSEEEADRLIKIFEEKNYFYYLTHKYMVTSSSGLISSGNLRKPMNDKDEKIVSDYYANVATDKKLVDEIHERYLIGKGFNDLFSKYNISLDDI